MKKKLVFKAPVLTASGYGVHSRQILSALLEMDEFDVHVIPIAWGSTSFLLGNDPLVETVKELSNKREKAGPNARYDVSIQVTIPNEFEKLAHINIGITAGIEVDRVSPEWLKKCNENVDLVIVPSLHAARAFSVRYQDAGLQLQKPLAICPEGFDPAIFNTDPIEQSFDFDTDFNFLAVGLGLSAGIGDERKNISGLIKAFLERYKDDKTVGLVAKVAIVNSSLLDFEHTKVKIQEIRKAVGANEFPRIHLIHGYLSDREMASLYKHPKIKALVSLTHGEGYGLPLLEAAACGLPVIATDWSGHLDFLKVGQNKRFVPVPFEMKPIADSSVWNGVIEKGSHWAWPKYDDAKNLMKRVQLSYDKPKEWATELAVSLSKTHTLAAVSDHLKNTIRSFLKDAVKAKPVSRESFVDERKRMYSALGTKTLLYTMPMSAGDVYVSTGVVSSLKRKFPDHSIIFATNAQYTDILKDNPDISAVIQWEQWMADISVCEEIFDEVYTPNLTVQMTFSNWLHKGKGRKLADEFANACLVEYSSPFISMEKVELPFEEGEFLVFSPGSGQGQWEARNYLYWQDVIDNLRRIYPKVQILQTGTANEPLYEGVIDMRGKTTYNQLGYLIDLAAGVIGIDSLVMHMAAGLDTPFVAIYGSSYASSTSPVCKTKLRLLVGDDDEIVKDLGLNIETPSRYSCDKACYKYQCKVDRANPCINEIAPDKLFASISSHFELNRFYEPQGTYQERRPKISGYTHTLNAKSQGYPFVESVKSMLGFCDEVVVVDGGSTDGTLEDLKAIGDEKLKIFDRAWDWGEPGMDGKQKAFGRAMCDPSSDFLWQQDVDEVVHEKDYEKIVKMAKRFPKGQLVMHLPVVELWGDPWTVRTDRHSWKWRLSRNDFKVTHGINIHARVMDEKTGKTFSKKGMSDGCEYIDIMTGEYLPHFGFYTPELEQLRLDDPAAWGERMNSLFEQLPSVYHYSWASIPRKIKNFRDFWDKCWSNLYNDPAPTPRFPDVKTDDDVRRKSLEMIEQGGEHGKAKTFKLKGTNPAVMSDWIAKGWAGE